MGGMVKLSRITLYPIKALDGVDVPSATVLPSGALQNDRRFALVDAAYQYINGKSTAAIHRIRAEYSADLSTVRLSLGGEAESQQFDWPGDMAGVAGWLSQVLGRRCRLVENAVAGHPDDRDSPGPTLIGVATLAATAAWFDGVSVDEMRRRLRANLEADAAEPFWEDQLPFRAPPGHGPEFSIGGVKLRAWNVCQRCIVPTRDALTGESTPGFAKQFVERRRAELPPWSPPERFEDFYRAAINTRIAPGAQGGEIRVGDELA